MRAMTLTQPWAGLVASGIKMIENRSRHIVRRSDIGCRFAIHASREIDPFVYNRIREIAPELVPTFDYDGGWWSLTRITSAVIAMATLTDIIDLSKSCDRDREAILLGLPPDQRRFTFGPVAYVLGDIKPLARSVPARGMLGFWTMPVNVERDVLAAA